ncbi:MAG: hypothetical protein K0S60_57 [Evtepia sp.]|jgi:hypothetical protein|nr:hypothetical protein [Evtepia sp.]
MHQVYLDRVDTSTAQHNYGVDSIKVISMFMVVVLHVFGQGGILKTVTFGTLNYYISWCMEIAAFCAVNCFALTTGYLSIDKTVRFSKLILLWLQVAAYSIGITFFFWLLRPDTVNLQQVINSCFPVVNTSYWYFTAYFGLFFFTPFINKLFDCLDRPLINQLIATVFVLLSILPLFTKTDLFQLSKGYSMTWLCALYMIGGYIKRYDALPKLRKGNFGLYLFMIGFVCLSKFVMESIAMVPGRESCNSLLFVSYTSPFILLASVFLFLFLSRVHFKTNISRKIVMFFAPISFGVYLIHTHPVVWNYLLINRFAKYATLSPQFLIGFVLLTAISIFISCSLVDLIRKKLFTLFRFPAFSVYLEDLCSKALRRLLKNHN